MKKTRNHSKPGAGESSQENVERARVRELLELDFSRKPYAWHEIETKAVPVEWLAKLSQADILGQEPFSEFTAEAPAQFFLARNAAGLFLVNHEGYKYPRYVLRVDETTIHHARH